MKSRRVSRVVSAPPEFVYMFASNPENLPRCAAGLATTDVVREGDSPVVDSPFPFLTVNAMNT